MAGGLMQLVAYGTQDVYLTGNPQLSFWKVTYRRHTNFAMESIEQTFNGQADFGRRITCTIGRYGDLAYRTYLQVTLPEINQQMLNGSSTTASANDGVYARWLDFPGEHLISSVEIEIGGQRIDRQYGDWMHIWNQLTLTKEQERGYNKMIGNTTQLTFITDPSFANIDGPCDSDAPRQVCAPRNALPETTLYIPFQFWYCRNPGLALPLIALQYHEVKINLDLRPIDEMLWAVSGLSCSERVPNYLYLIPDENSQGGFASMAFVGNYYYLPIGTTVFDATDNPWIIATFSGTAPGLTEVGFTESFIGDNDFIAGNSYRTDYVSSYSSGPGSKVLAAYNQSLVAGSLYIDYVFLDTDERRRMAQNPHEYLIEQVQFSGDESVGSSSNKIHLNFNHPCKELIWVVQPDANVDYCSSLECGSVLFRTLGAQPFNYSDAVDALPNSIMAFGGPLGVAETTNAFISQSGLFADPGAVDVSAFEFWNQPAMGGAVGAYSSGGGGNSAQPAYGGEESAFDESNSAGGFANATNFVSNSGISDAGTFVLTETSIDLHCWGENPVVTAKLQLNGQDRFSEREGSYFGLVQPYQHHTRSPDTGINVYSFALRPEEHQPSGTCNFSRIDNTTLNLILSNATVEGTSTAKVRVYATNYNVLRVMSGMGGLAYSN